jgi:chromosome partitioning protein
MGESLRSLGLGIVAVANQKGGVGKTTTVIELASGLARSGARVLAVDGDPQGNLSLFFGSSENAAGDVASEPGTGEAGAKEGGAAAKGLARAKRDFSDLIGDLLAGRLEPADDYLAPGVRKNLDLLPATHRHLRRERSDADMLAAAPAFSAFLAGLKPRYDWILIDCSPSNGALERLLVRACEAVLVPLEFQLFSVAGLKSILEDVSACTQEAGHGIRVHALVFTKAENRVARVESYREVFSAFRIPIFEVCKSEYIPRSLERSRTIWESGPSSFAARDYARIIEKAFLE